ncbi:hypothetical protein NP234_24370 [Salmonella enterica]|nr:hypothetical protein [Salmonella enterica]
MPQLSRKRKAVAAASPPLSAPPAAAPPIVVVETSDDAAEQPSKGKGKQQGIPMVVEEESPGQGPLLMPDTRVFDASFIVPDVPEALVDQMMALPPRYHLPFQAIYSLCHEKHWDSIASKGVLDRQRFQVWCLAQVSLRPLLFSFFCRLLMMYY